MITDRSLVMRLLAIVVSTSLVACAQAQSNPTAVALPKLDAKKYADMLNDAAALMHQGHPGEAISKDLDPLIDAYERAYLDFKPRVYSTRSVPETIYYMATSVTAKDAWVDPAGGPGAVAIDQVWGLALYMKAYALIELHRIAQAHDPLERAVHLSPMNSQYLSELGQLYQIERDWPRALATYREAEHAAELSPPALKAKEQSRAWRGIAFVDVELGKLDEAIELYQRCLALNADDQSAARELQYVRAQQAKQAGKQRPGSP